jgi:hypothetical protein
LCSGQVENLKVEYAVLCFANHRIWVVSTPGKGSTFKMEPATEPILQEDTMRIVEDQEDLRA